ncbi:MAG: ABC transporter ATP-binding protein, partial [Clostridia bacterium]|nr:ABC transporter ATP-binding protein [Clostridia bacterium]
MKMVKRFCAYYKPYLKTFTLDMLCALGVALCNLVYPKLTGLMIDDYIVNGKVKLILILAAVLVVLYIAKKSMNY